MIKRILVALSGTPCTEAAVRHAIALAATHDAGLTGVTIVNLKALENVGPVPIGGGAAAHDLAEHRKLVTEERVRAAIEEFEKACADAQRPCAVLHETGDPFQRLRDLWRYHDLTILGLRGLFEYGIVQNSDDYLIRLIHDGVRPLLAVAEEYREIKRVIIAYDGSLSSSKAMKRFVQSHPWPEVTIQIVHFGEDAEIEGALLSDAADYCRAHGMTTETRHLEGHVDQGLLSHAEGWGADLIVMGSRTKGRLSRLMLGDTCLHVIHHARMPLYLTR